MQAFPELPINTEMPLQLLLFVDKRTSAGEQIRQVRQTLKDLQANYPFELEIIDVGEQPYLAEHFRLVATPALVKIHPEPRQVLTGSNLIAQLNYWWAQWQRSAQAFRDHPTPPEPPAEQETDHPQTVTESNGHLSPPLSPPIWGERSSHSHFSMTQSAELLRLSDEVFRLQRDKEDLLNQLKFKDQIIAMLAHDLRNPLTAVSIALETLEMSHNPTEGWSSRLTPVLTAQLLRHARTQTYAIDRMVTDILQAAKGDKSELKIQPHRLDLRNLALEVLDQMQERFTAKDQTVSRDIPSDLPPVLADGERVRQILVNLLDNAIKYTPINGDVSISILHRTTQKIQVSICDNGPGIPEENYQRIFEDRFRLERDTKQEGYGIGLSLCQRLIRAHYGQIWVDSVLGQGSCFHFTLPVLGR